MFENPVIKTKNLVLQNLTQAHESRLLEIVQTDGFFYPLIQANKKYAQDSLTQRVAWYIQWAETTRHEMPRTTYIMGIFAKENTDHLLGAVIMNKNNPNLRGGGRGCTASLGSGVFCGYTAQG